MSYFWNLISKIKQKKEFESQPQIYLDIEQIPLEINKESIEKENSCVIIDLFSPDEE